jgi:surface protein
MDISKKNTEKNYQKLKSPNLFHKICIIIILIIEIDLVKSNLRCQIDIKIKGKGEQNILFEHSITNFNGKEVKFDYEPNEIYVNNILQENKNNNKKVYNLNDGINNITIIFNTKLLYLTGMFANLHNIKEIDFSNCDTSLVTNMEYTFFECTSLVSLNLEHFNTTSVKNMYAIFSN